MTGAAVAPRAGPDGAEDAGPGAAGIAGCARAAAARGPDAGRRALLACPRVRHGPRSDGGLHGELPEPDFEGPSAGGRRARPRRPSRRSFFNALSCGVGLRVLRAHREAAKAECRQLLAPSGLPWVRSCRVTPKRAAIRAEGPRAARAPHRPRQRAGPSRTLCANATLCAGRGRGAGPAGRRFDSPSGLRRPSDETGRGASADPSRSARRRSCGPPLRNPREGQHPPRRRRILRFRGHSPKRARRKLCRCDRNRHQPLHRAVPAPHDTKPKGTLRESKTRAVGIARRCSPCEKRRARTLGQGAIRATSREVRRTSNSRSRRR
jgi:hypothetical protein